MARVKSSMVWLVMLFAMLLFSPEISKAEGPAVPVLNIPAYTIAGEECPISVSNLNAEEISNWTFYVTERSTERVVYNLNKSNSKLYTFDASTGVCELSIPAQIGSYYSQTTTLEANKEYTIRFTVYDTQGFSEETTAYLFAFSSQNGEAPVLTINGKKETQTLGINEMYTWSLELSEMNTSRTYVRFRDNGEWIYYTAQDRTLSSYGTTLSLPGVYSLFAQYLESGSSPYSSEAVWSPPSNIVTLMTEKKGEAFPGTLSIENANAEVKRGDNLVYSFTEGQNAKAYSIYILNENGDQVGTTSEFTGPEENLEYPTAFLNPGNYILTLKIKGTPGYDDRNAIISQSFVISDANESGLVFTTNKTEGLIKESIVFSAYHNQATRYSVAYTTKEGETNAVKAWMQNGAVWGTLNLNEEMQSITAVALDSQGNSLAQKTISLRTVSYGAPEIAIIAPDSITIGEDLEFTVILPKISGSTTPNITVNIMDNQTQAKIEFDKTTNYDSNGNILVQCKLTANKIPLSGVYVYGMYDPETPGWELANISRYFYYSITPPSMSLSADRITVGSSVTVTLEKTEDASYYAVMPYFVLSSGERIALLENEIYMTFESEDELQYTFPVTCFLEEGNYQITARAVPNTALRRGSSTTKMLTVTADSDEQAVFVLQERAAYYSDEYVSFKFSKTFEEYKVKIMCQNGDDLEGYDRFDARWNSAEDRTEVQIRFREAGTYVVRGMIKEEGKWLRLSAPITIIVSAKEQLTEPVIQIIEDSLRAGQDIDVLYSLDSKVEEASYSLYKGTNGSFNQLIATGSLPCSKSTITLDGGYLFSGDYKFTVECSASEYSSSSSFATFVLSGEREIGPALNVSSQTAYVNTDITFTVEQTGATALRIQYSRDQSGSGNSFSEEIVSDTGYFTWTNSCTEFVTGQTSFSWFVKVMARINGVWSDWGNATAITIKTKGVLETPAFTKITEQIEPGEPLHVTVSSVSNANEYRFELFEMQEDGTESAFVMKQTTTSNDVVLLSGEKTSKLSKGLYLLKCYAFGSGYVSSGTASAVFRVGQIAGQNKLELPSETRTIEEYAFEGVAAKVVLIPDGCTEIQAYAFANMLNLREVHIPSSVTFIDDHAFDGCEGLLIYTDSEYVIEYAKKCHWEYVAE